LQIPEESRSTVPEETLKLCGLKVRLSDAQTEARGYWWTYPDGAESFWRVRIGKFSNDGPFTDCEAHIKVE
jgi:hypothetical protein